MYPAGNTEDKFLIVLNKIHLPTQAIIVTPCTTNKAQRNYNPGCNHKVPIFLLRPKEDFFENETVVQLFIIDAIEEVIFERKKSKKIIEYHASLNTSTVARLAKCLDEIKEDIPQDLHLFLF